MKEKNKDHKIEAVIILILYAIVIVCVLVIPFSIECAKAAVKPDTVAWEDAYILGVYKTLQPQYCNPTGGYDYRDEYTVAFVIDRTDEVIEITMPMEERDFFKEHLAERCVIERQDYSGDTLRYQFLRLGEL